MDSLTHIAIGACIGDLFLGKKIGKKAMLYGAIAASLPDIDFVASFWLNTADDLMAHRGITHSFLFGIVIMMALAFLFRHRHRVENIRIKTWLLFMGVSILSHLFLDAFNAYGIGWLEPFSHQRFSFNVIFVADPFFSIWPAIAAVALLILRNHSPARKAWARSGLILCSLYLIYCVTNKFKTDDSIRYALGHQNIHYKRYFTTPTPFNNWLWFDVAETEKGFYIGYYSVFDKTKQIDFHYFPTNDSLLKPFYNHRDLQQLITFSQGYYTAELQKNGLPGLEKVSIVGSGKYDTLNRSGETVVFNDLRFGQMNGWEYPDAGFVFHYYLQDPEANHLVVQRGRFTNWSWQTVKYMCKRIEGKSKRIEGKCY